MTSLYNLCSEGDINKVLDAIDKGANDWDNGLAKACLGGHMNIVNLMIEKGANNWNRGLWYACLGGHMIIINLMIEKGANDWNGGLWVALWVGHVIIVNLLVEKGATNISNFYSYPKSHNNILTLLELGTPISKLMNINGIDILVNNLKQFKVMTYNELYQYMPKELANIISNYCLL